MKITFLGTGAAEGVPAAFCNCINCRTIRAEGIKSFRSRSQVLIDDVLSVDFPPEAYAHSLRFGVDFSALKYVLVTHSHMDHFYAHDFILRGYKYADVAGTLKLYGNEEVMKVFSECTRREMKPEVACGIEKITLHPFERFTVGDYNVLTLPAQHGTQEEALLYYIEKEDKGYLHLYDTGALSDAAVEFLAKNGAQASLIAFDCTFLDAQPRRGTRHMCLSDNMSILSRLKEAGVADSNTKCVITHFSHNSNPTRDRISEIEKKYPVVAAYDGYTLEI